MDSVLWETHCRILRRGWDSKIYILESSARCQSGDDIGGRRLMEDELWAMGVVLVKGNHYVSDLLGEHLKSLTASLLHYFILRVVFMWWQLLYISLLTKHWGRGTSKILHFLWLRQAFLHLGRAVMSPEGWEIRNCHVLLAMKRGHKCLPGSRHKPVQGALENVQNFQQFWNVGIGRGHCLASSAYRNWLSTHSTSVPSPTRLQLWPFWGSQGNLKYICSRDSGIILRAFFFSGLLILWIQFPQFPANCTPPNKNYLTPPTRDSGAVQVGREWWWEECYLEAWDTVAWCYNLHPFLQMSLSLFLVISLLSSFDGLGRLWNFETGNRIKVCVCFSIPQCSQLDSYLGRAVTNPEKVRGP